MTRATIVIGCFVAACLCVVTFLAISQQTVVPLIARGSGPDGVQVTSTGWFALVISALGALGFSASGIITALVKSIGLPIKDGTVTDESLAEIAELTASFTAYLRDRSNRAAQRRFVFALVDSVKLIRGCETSHEGGVIVVKYSGYADPLPKSTEAKE